MSALNKSHSLSDREVATILAALRCYQQAENSRDFEDVATDEGEFEAMDNAEIDKLCHRISL